MAVTSVTFGATGSGVLAAGSCGTSGGTALFSYPPSGRWQRLSLPVPGSLVLAGGGAWVLLPGGRAATIGGIGQQWLLLPPLPAKSSVLASGPNGALDALAVSGTALTVWRLARASTVWTRLQSIAVPVQDGSSS